MTNERLRAALLQNGFTPNSLAVKLGVDTKTVERWVKGRVPHRSNRYTLSSTLGFDEAYLWPDALSRDQVAAASSSEILAVYPHRSEIPRDVWHRLFEATDEEIGILVYAGLFMAEDSRLHKIFLKKAKAGVRVRLLLGDPDDLHVTERGNEEGIGEAVSAKVRNALVLYQSLRGVDGIEFRLHRTVLYNSIYRADDQLIVNTHVYGLPAPQAPAWHLRKVAGGELTNVYLESFERVWDKAHPLAED
jgi:transcriptional regulator with XRE-family HTH domain